MCIPKKKITISLAGNFYASSFCFFVTSFFFVLEATAKVLLCHCTFPIFELVLLRLSDQAQIWLPQAMINDFSYPQRLRSSSTSSAESGIYGRQHYNFLTVHFFVREIFPKLGFGLKEKKMIASCISSLSYSIGAYRIWRWRRAPGCGGWIDHASTPMKPAKPWPCGETQEHLLHSGACLT